MKDIDNVVFTDEILEKYKADSEKITELCKKIDKNKIFQKKYRKFLEGKERIIHFSEQENKQLKDNWNKLKEFIKKEGFEINTREYGSLDVVDKYAIIEKMQKLEKIGVHNYKNLQWDAIEIIGDDK